MREAAALRLQVLNTALLIAVVVGGVAFARTVIDAIDLGAWRIRHDGTQSGIKLKETWLASWPEATLGQTARLAFQWALFPTRQEFMPGDYNWGMTAYGLSAGSVFDLQVIWQSGGQTEAGWIRGIECAPDVDKLK